MRYLALLVLCLTQPLRAGDVVGDDFNEEDNQEYVSLPRLHLSGQYGYSQWLFSPDSVSPSYDKYLDKLETGTSVSASLVYFFWPKGGIGFNWILFTSRESDTTVGMNIRDPSLHVLKERVSVYYWGPDFLTRLHLSQNIMLVGGLGAGYLHFLNTGYDNGVPFKIEAHNYAVQTHVGCDYSLMRYWAIGIEGRFVFSNLREYTYNGKKVVLEDPENNFMWYNVPLYRLELSLGIHLML
jgi:hypothetical protein